MYLISPSSPEPHWWLSACSLAWIQPHNEFLLSGSSKEHRTITDALLFKHRKNCETALTPGIPSIPGIPVLWNLAEIVKFGQPPSVWSGRVRIHSKDGMVRLRISLGLSFEVVYNVSLGVFSKCICHRLHFVFVFVVVFLLGQVIFSHHSDQMSQRSKVSKIVLWRCSLNVFVIVFFLVRSCFLIILSKRLCLDS